MGFQLEVIEDITNEGIIKGMQREIACECWFTSKGKTKPILIKVMDEEGIIHTITDIQVLYSEEKNYSGIRTIEHVCKINLYNRIDTVKIIYNKETCKWTIITV